MSLHTILSTECTGVAGVLAYFHFLDLFAEGGAVSICFDGLGRRCGLIGGKGRGRGGDLVPYLPVTPTSMKELVDAGRRRGMWEGMGEDILFVRFVMAVDEVWCDGEKEVDGRCR